MYYQQLKDVALYGHEQGIEPGLIELLVQGAWVLLLQETEGEEAVRELEQAVEQVYQELYD